MKSFISEYGFAIVGAVIIIILILMVSPIAKPIQHSYMENVNQLTDYSTTVTDQMNEKVPDALEHFNDDIVEAPDQDSADEEH